MDKRCWILGLLACLVLAGCTTTRYVPVPQVSVDSVYVDRWFRDSVYLHDSVFVDRWTQGDTVYVDRMVTKYRYRDRWRYDTVAVLRADTVSVPCPVEKEPGWWQRVRMDAFPVLLGIGGRAGVHRRVAREESQEEAIKALSPGSGSKGGILPNPELYKVAKRERKGKHRSKLIEGRFCPEIDRNR